MFLLLQPSPGLIEAFVAESRALPLTYAPVGIVYSPPPRFDLDELTMTIGRGQRDFARARAALEAWRHFSLGWLEIFPRQAGVSVGTAVAVVIRHAGMWSMNGCRVVEAIDTPERFAFSYGTLANHAERGEELFEVTLDPGSGDVRYRIRAASQPRAALARLGYPLARVLQARCRRESAEAMRRIVTGGAS